MKQITTLNIGLIPYITSLSDLTGEEEKQLIIAYRHNGDNQSAQKLILHSMKRVVMHAVNYSRAYNIERDDLVQEGAHGLLRALETYDETRGTRFTTHAERWITGAMNNFVNRNIKMVPLHTTKGESKVWFNRHQVEACKTEEDFKALSLELNLTVDEIKRAYERVQTQTVYIDQCSDEGNPFEVEDQMDLYGLVEDVDEYTYRKTFVNSSIKTLPDTHQFVLKSRMKDNPPTYSKLGKELGISLQRVKQIELEAIKKIQDHI